MQCRPPIAISSAHSTRPSVSVFDVFNSFNWFLCSLSDVNAKNLLTAPRLFEQCFCCVACNDRPCQLKRIEENFWFISFFLWTGNLSQLSPFVVSARRSWNVYVQTAWPRIYARRSKFTINFETDIARRRHLFVKHSINHIRNKCAQSAGHSAQ